MAHCLDRDRSYLFTWPDRSLSDTQLECFRTLTVRRAAQIPLAQLTGRREFWSMDFQVTKDTLIPRPDTELLVELSLDLLNKHPGPVLDLGTGCGIVAICIASEMPHLRVDAVDHSAAALAVARDNAQANKAEVNFLLSDWFEQVAQRDYRLIVSNPPYLAADDEHLQLDGLQHEPQSALVAADNGLAAIKTIIEQAARYTDQPATVMMEHSHSQGPQVRALMLEQGFHKVTTHRDIECRERVTLATIIQ